MNRSKALFFDMDNTVLTVDSMIAFFFFYLKKNKKKMPLVALVIVFKFLPLLTLSFLKFPKKYINELVLKNALFSSLQYKDETEAKKEILQFFNSSWEKMLDKDFIYFLKNNNEFDVYIISASSQLFVDCFVDLLKEKYGATCFAYGSETTFISNKIYFSTNLKGKLKGILVKSLIQEKGYRFSAAFGDSSEDKHMLKMCHTGFVGRYPIKKIKDVL